MKAILTPIAWSLPQPLIPDLPVQVAIPTNQRIPVVLDISLSSGVSKQGQSVTFHTVYSLLLGNGLEVPPDTKITGHVVSVKRAAHFGGEGELRLAVDRIVLGPEDAANLIAHLDSPEMRGNGRFAVENSHSSDVTADAGKVALGAAGSAAIGALTGGAKGAGFGAGTGALVAVLIMSSPRGQEVYLEQGMRFSVIVDQPAYLNGSAVYAAQQAFLKSRGTSTLEPDSQSDGQPKLKRRRPSHN